MNVIFSKCSDAITYATENKSFGVFHSTAVGGYDNIHIHDCCEIFFCIKGKGNIFVDEKVYSLNTGDLFVMNQFEAHKISPDSDTEFERYALHIHPSFLYASSTTDTDLSRCFSIRGNNISHKSNITKDQYDELYMLFKKLSKVSEYGDDIIKTLTGIEIITFANKLFKIQNKEHTYHSSMENKTVDIAIEYINTNFHSTLNLDIVAKNSFVSVNELCRLFKKHLGTTVSKYIMSKRISEAKKMLKNGASVLQTADGCGFSDYTSFIRAFNRAVGMSPGKYKKSE